MSRKKKGKKLQESFVSGKDEISKYKRIKDIKFHPGRPGEEYYEVIDEDGRSTLLSPDEKRRLDKLLTKEDPESDEG